MIMERLISGYLWRFFLATIGLTTNLILASGLGPLVGEFSIHPLKQGLAKNSATHALGQINSRAQAIARVTEDFDPNTLTPLGWSLVNNYKGIATLEGELNTFASVQELAGILEINLARKVSPTMEAARKLSRIDPILKWGPRPASGGVNGKGVLIGMVDFGFDTRHPAFLDSAGKTRFLAIWDPNLPTTIGAPYKRGQLKSGQQLEQDAAFGQHDGDEHGTNVTSVAAGSDGSNPYYGIAPEASIIAVNLSTKKDSADLESNVMNGISWIFHVADSLKKPAVVNLSLGNSHMGPHDGTSLFDRFLDSIGGPGHIIVGAMGNDGDKNLHANFTLAKSGETTGTFCPIPAAIDLWGEAGKPFKFQVLIMDSASHTYQASTTFLSTTLGNGMPLGDSIVWTNPITQKKQGFLVFVMMYRANAGNNKPHVELTMIPAKPDSSPNPEFPMMGIRLVGTGSLQAWNGTSKSFSSQGIPGFINGDNKMTLSEIGGTAKSIISVGSYVSTKDFTDYTGKFQDNAVNQSVGELAYWTSLGPAADGRIKPDLCAPGRVIVSAMSSAIVNPSPWQLSRLIYWPNQTNNIGRYFATEGTSLSAPMVTGVVALMLEKSPKLTPLSAKDILTKTAYKDSFTGSLTSPNASWGAGKLDATAALVMSSGGTVWTKSAGAPNLKPKATFYGGFLHIDGIVFPEKIKATIIDWNGRWVSDLSMHSGNRFVMATPNLRKGIYFARLDFGQAPYVIPFLLGFK